MKKFIRSFSALTLCVLCLISMVAPIFSMELAITAAECPYPGGHALGIDVHHNDWYHYSVYTRDADAHCYRVYNARCERRCVYCNYIEYVDCDDTQHGGNTQHSWTEATEADPNLYVCSNGDCHETKYFYFGN